MSVTAPEPTAAKPTSPDPAAPEPSAPEPEAPEPSALTPVAASEPGPRAVRFANVTLAVAIFAALSQVALALHLHRPTLLVVLPLLTAVLLAAAYKLRPSSRLVAALVVLPALVLVYGFEWRISRARPYKGTMAAGRGDSFDTRALWEVVRDMRAEGRDTHPSLRPRSLLVLNLKKGISSDEADNHALSPDWGVEIDGQRVLPLGGIANQHTIHCNEGGKWSEYESDELGFNNPKGLWARDSLDVVLLGDSFTQAACVDAHQNAAHHIRQKHPATANLAMSGNGPLLELAGLEEFAAPKKPKVVLWFYYANDLPDLDFEKTVPLLKRYLEEDGFSQKLAEKQAKIDAALVAVSGRIEAFAPPWSPTLAAVGLTRRNTPMWLSDIAMNENTSATSAVLRLDRLTYGVTRLAVADFLNAPPDYPLFQKVLERARSRVESWGGKLYFVYVPDMWYLQFRGKRDNEHRAPVLAAAKAVGLPIIDAHPRFLEVEDLASIRYHPESHCNPAGYKLLSEIVLKAIE